MMAGLPAVGLYFKSQGGGEGDSVVLLKAGTAEGTEYRSEKHQPKQGV